MQLLPVTDGGGVAPRVHNEDLLDVLAPGHLGGQVPQGGDLPVGQGGRGRGGHGRGDAVHITVRAALWITKKNFDLILRKVYKCKM